MGKEGRAFDHLGLMHRWVPTEHGASVSVWKTVSIGTRMGYGLLHG